MLECIRRLKTNRLDVAVVSTDSIGRPHARISYACTRRRCGIWNGRIAERSSEGSAFHAPLAHCAATTRSSLPLCCSRRARRQSASSGGASLEVGEAGEKDGLH